MFHSKGSSDGFPRRSRGVSIIFNRFFIKDFQPTEQFPKFGIRSSSFIITNKDSLRPLRSIGKKKKLK